MNYCISLESSFRSVDRRTITIGHKDATRGVACGDLETRVRLKVTEDQSLGYGFLTAELNFDPIRRTVWAWLTPVTMPTNERTDQS